MGTRPDGGCCCCWCICMGGGRPPGKPGCSCWGAADSGGACKNPGGGPPQRGEGAALIDARRGEVDVQRVRVDDEGVVALLDEPWAAAPDDAADRVGAAAFLVGSGVGLVTSTGRCVDALGPSAAGLAGTLHRRLEGAPAVDETQTLIPLCCRPPDAKLPAPRTG